MNLRRGLLRLWVLLALIWIVPTTWLLRDALTMSEHLFVVTTAAGKPQYEIKGPPGATKEKALQKFKELTLEQQRALANAKARMAVSSIGKPAFDPNQPFQATPPGAANPSKLAEFRQKYPEYSDMSDSALADAIYKKYYSDLARDQFNAKIGLTEEQATVTDEFVADWPRRWEAIAIVILPPLGVLVFGVGLFWVFQGFRATRS